MKKLLLLLALASSAYAMQENKDTALAKANSSPERPRIIYEEVPDLPKRDESPAPSNESNESEDTVPRRHHHRALWISNTITALGTAALSAGVAIATNYLNNKCGGTTPPTLPPQ